MKKITIPLEEYQELQVQGLWLDCLDEAGVNSWDGINFARLLFKERAPE